MPDKIIYIYIWKTIERIAFSPRGEKEIRDWLKQYASFIIKLKTGSREIIKAKNSIYDLNLDNLKIRFSNCFNLPKFRIDLIQNEVVQYLEYDEKYISEQEIADYFIQAVEKQKNIKGKPTKQSINLFIDKQFAKKVSEYRITTNDIKIVLESMISHPAIHVHLEHISHEFRIGFNTKNPFLFLFHIAFQFCDLENNLHNSELKKNEFNRLVEIINRNIKADTISSGVLFGK
jgi:hypothetical protein